MNVLSINVGLPRVKRSWRSRRCGFYLSVAREGEISAGDEIRLTRAPGSEATIAEAFAARQ